MSSSVNTAVVVPLVVYAVAVPMPGPSFVVIAQASFGAGRIGGAVAALGTTLGVAVYATATLVGISVLAAALPGLVTAIQMLGGAYLVYLGFSALRALLATSPFVSKPLTREPPSSVRIFRKAVIVSLGNPKMAAFFFGLFASVVGPSQSNDARLLVLAGVLLIDLFYHQVLATGLVLIAASRPGKRAQRWLDAVAGTLMTAFGIGLLIDAARSRRSPFSAHCRRPP